MNLSVVSLGHVHTEAIEPLTKHLTRLEQVVTNLPPRVKLADARAELNRAIDAAANDWILMVREREIVDESLAAEIAAKCGASPLAGRSEDRPHTSFGYRIRSVPMYAGKPLRLEDAGELRLFHRRHLLRRGEIMVEGSVVRLENTLHAMTFASADDHRAYLIVHAVRHSTLRRTLIFLRNARTLDANTIRYLWIEAGFGQAI